MKPHTLSTAIESAKILAAIAKKSGYTQIVQDSEFIALLANPSLAGYAKPLIKIYTQTYNA